VVQEMESSLFDQERLFKIAKKIDGQGYGSAYALLGAYDLGDGIILAIESIPKRPDFPLPGKVSLFLPFNLLGYNKEIILKDELAVIAAKHFFAELTYQNLRYIGRNWLFLEPPGQAMLDRNSIEIYDEGIKINVAFYPPLKTKRKLSGGKIRRLFGESLNLLIERIKATNKKRELLEKMIKLIKAQEYLRRKLDEEGFVAFIADGSILPREGNSDRPLKNAIPFEVPEKLKTSFKVPHFGEITGLAIEAGKVISFAGANFHGKTTIIEALMQGHYNHVPGDGREFVITVDELPLIAVENRRIVRGVDISFFMRSLPGDVDTSFFTTNEASGSTSQAASFMEALELGVRGMVIDEDSSAVNFLVKDVLLKKIVPEDLEPITPLAEVAREISRTTNASIIFAVGALGELVRVSHVTYIVSNFKVSDKIEGSDSASLDSYLPRDALRLMRDEFLKEIKAIKIKISREKKIKINRRFVSSESLPVMRAKSYSYDEIVFTSMGRRVIVDLRGSIRKTLKERAQVRALAYAIEKIRVFMSEKKTLKDVVVELIQKVRDEGLDILNPMPEYFLNFAMFTKWQLFYAISRLRNLKVLK